MLQASKEVTAPPTDPLQACYETTERLLNDLGDMAASIVAIADVIARRAYEGSPAELGLAIKKLARQAQDLLNEADVELEEVASQVNATGRRAREENCNG